MKRIVNIHAYWQILIAQVFLIFLAAFMEDYFVFYILFALGTLDIFGWVIVSVLKRRWFKAIAIVIGIAAVGSGAAAFFVQANEEALLYILTLVAAFSFAAFALIAILAMIKGVFMTDEVTSDIVVGSICIYIMIGMFFAFIYAAAAIINPYSFNLAGHTYGSLESLRDYLYFSFVTLTTLGYGDMVPTAAMSKMLSSMEAVTGPVYLAILVARLVGQHMSQRMARKS